MRLGVVGKLTTPLPFLAMRKFCVCCGIPYHYNTENPKGATPYNCPSCQKRGAKQDKKLRLLFIAGNDDVRCRVCGYDRYIESLTTYPVKDFIRKTDPDTIAKKSFVICFNCKAALDSKQIIMEVKDSSAYPVSVGFYDNNVVIDQNPIVQKILRPSSDDAVLLEVVNEKEKLTELRSVSPPKKGSGGSNPEEV